MPGKVIFALELLIALRALETPLSRVSPIVTLQIVRTKETLATGGPFAEVGAIPAVPTQMLPQTPCIVVHLVAV